MLTIVKPREARAMKCVSRRGCDHELYEETLVGQRTAVWGFGFTFRLNYPWSTAILGSRSDVIIHGSRGDCKMD